MRGTKKQDPIEWVRNTNQVFDLCKIAPEVRIKYIKFILEDKIRDKIEKTKDWQDM